MAAYKFLVSEKQFAPGDTICALGSTPCKLDNSKRIQVNETTFILPPAIIYHSCNPNSFIDWKTMELKALKPIEIGETITYHYGTSEDDYTVGAFHCECGAKHCVGEFRGFKFMSTEDRVTIKPHLSPFLLRKYYPSEQ